jgi:hypothetical protein
MFNSVGGDPDRNLVRCNGASWTAVGDIVRTTVDESVRALGVFDGGGEPALYVGGEFLGAGGVPANIMARRDGRAWALLGSGVSGATSVAGFDDGRGPALWVSGGFRSAGRTTHGGSPAGARVLRGTTPPATAERRRRD